jgi:hypothetical protein
MSEHSPTVSLVSLREDGGAMRIHWTERQDNRIIAHCTVLPTAVFLAAHRLLMRQSLAAIGSEKAP